MPNGHFGLNKVLFSGKFGEKTNYGGFERCEPRKDEDIMRQVAEIMKQSTMTAQAKLEAKYGVRYTELSRLPYFFPTFTTIDPLHCLYLGIGKAMIKDIWPEEDGLDSIALLDIQEHVTLTLAPEEIGSVPYKIASAFSSFNGEELKNWILYFSAFCMYSHLSEDAYSCWMHFVNACCQFSRPVIDMTQVKEGNEALLRFCRSFESLYGSDLVKPNMHFATHIIDCILDFGPIYGFWLFSFERMNGIMGSYHTNQRAVETQIFHKFLRNQSLALAQSPPVFREVFEECIQGLSIVDSTSVRGEQVTVLKDATVLNLAHGDVQVGPELYDAKLVTLCGRKSSGLLDTDSTKHLAESLEAFLGPIDRTKFTGAHNKYSSIKFVNTVFGSVTSGLHKRSCRVLASWCGLDGEINSRGSSPRPGQIIAFLQLYVPLQNSNERLEVVLAEVDWLQRHGYTGPLGKPVASVWCRNVYEPDGPATFIPVHRIWTKCIIGSQTINGEHVAVVTPVIPQHYY